LRKLKVAERIGYHGFSPSARVLPNGRGAEALVLAILYGLHDPDMAGWCLDECGTLPFLQPGLM
jgi:hypothetical protein